MSDKFPEIGNFSLEYKLVPDKIAQVRYHPGITRVSQ